MLDSHGRRAAFLLRGVVCGGSPEAAGAEAPSTTPQAPKGGARRCVRTDVGLSEESYLSQA